MYQGWCTLPRFDTSPRPAFHGPDMTRIILPTFLLFLVATWPASAASLTFESAVQSIEGKIEPAEARPGQTVTYKLIIKLNPGHHTYPTVQPDKSEQASSNRIQLPDPGDLLFVEPVKDPEGLQTKPGAGGTLAYYPEGAVWEFKAVVSPKASAGERKVALKKVQVLICDKDNCLPPKTVKIEAGMRVVGEPVEVEPQFRDKVEQLLASAVPIKKDASPPTPIESEPPSPKSPPKGRGPQPPSPAPKSLDTPRDVPEPVEGPKTVARRLSANQDHAADMKAVLDQLPPPDRGNANFWAF